MRIPRLAFVLSLSFAASSPAIAAESQRPLGDLGKLGTVQFATTCDPSLHAEFDRGVALLHSFFYEEARRVFASVAEKDPECAMAHWGVAMTYYHPIWTAPGPEELAAGRAAAERALAAKKQEPREREWVQATAAYYLGESDPNASKEPGAPSCHAPGPNDHRDRALRFRNAMEEIARAHPDDVDAAAFFALSLLGTAPAADPELKNQKQAAEILEKWYAKQKNHPGLVHYLIHSYDYPSLARKGLPAARAYAAIAPQVPHALHMPSHIFTRLGMWKESIESNRASAEAARAYSAKYHPGAANFEEVHSLDYQMYGYLQSGQDAKARALLARLEAIDKFDSENDFVAAYAFGAMPARFALERRQWKEAASLAPKPRLSWDKLPFSEGHIAYARAVGAARSGDLAAARAAADRLEELAAASTEPRFKYFADQMEIQRDAALGLIALAEGRKDEAIVTLQNAADREDRLGKHPVSPGAMFPVRELLGEALLDAGRPREALEQFDASLAINPGRFNGFYGAARAAAATGDKKRAGQLYRDLAALAKDGDGTRPELGEVKELVAER
jgi:tetratricopeptide (TPR) repeat protein